MSPSFIAISSSSSREWLNIDSMLPALSERRELEDSGDFDRSDIL